MPANTLVWEFTQLHGKKDTLRLEDHAAPHGRAHKKPVVETDTELRTDRVYYSGNDIPTRHLFGAKDKNRVIEGRLKDSYGGKDFARLKKREIEEFFRGQQLCKVKWDDLVSFIGMVVGLKIGIESGACITYRIEVEVDSDDIVRNFQQIVAPRGPGEMDAQLRAALTNIDKLTKVPGMRGSIFDSISSLIGVVGTATSALNDITSQIDSFANAPFQLANQLRAALGQFRTAGTALRQTYDDLQAHIAIENDNANNWLDLWDVQAAWAASSLEAIRLAIEMERALAIAQQSQIKAIYTAREGDTWDQISRVSYNGSADRAGDIREFNGVTGGSNPVPGTDYMVPI